MTNPYALFKEYSEWLLRYINELAGHNLPWFYGLVFLIVLLSFGCGGGSAPQHKQAPQTSAGHTPRRLHSMREGRPPTHRWYVLHGRARRLRGEDV